MTWLAIDPSLRNTGWAVMDAKRVHWVGLMSTKREKGAKVYLDNLRCLSRIANGLVTLSAAYPKVPVYAEAKGGSKSSSAATAMAMSQAVLVGALVRHPIHLMLPKEVKKRICLNDKATKQDIRDAVDKLYPDAYQLMLATNLDYRYKKYNEHIYDAIAIGWAINQRENG